VRALSPEQAEEGMPVEVEAQVSYHDLSWSNLLLTDGKSGIYVQLSSKLPLDHVIPQGMRLRVKGVTAAGGFLPIILAEHLEELTVEPLPAPEHLTAVEQIFDPAKDCQWVQIEAVVKRVLEENGGVTIVLEVGGQVCNAMFPRHLKWDSLPTHFIGHRVSIDGVALTRFNHERQMTGRNIVVTSINAIKLLDPVRSGGDAPLRKVNEMLRVNSGFSEHVRLQGIVTYALPEHMLYLRGKGGCMRVDTVLTPPFQPGAVIEAEGYSTMLDLRPGLNAIVIRLLAHGTAPQPLVLDLKKQRSTFEQFELVTLDTDLIEILRPGQEKALLLCRDQGIAFEADIPSLDERLLDIAPGSRLRLVGICELNARRPYGMPSSPLDFRLHLRSPADVVVLAQPSYWTAQRLNQALALVLGVALLIAVWAYTLRKRVAKQAEVIRRQAEERATLDERQRIARELHDTLEQELTGVAMLLDTTAARFENAASSPAETLELARSLLRRSREESRSTICDLRSVTIEKLGLVGAMEAELPFIAKAAGIEFHFHTQGRVKRQDGVIESAFLRVAHEAVVNAVKHSRGKTLTVKMSFAAKKMELEVMDDGTGFQPGQVGNDQSGHFGLIGMRERAARIGAQLTLSAASPQGTVVKLCYTEP
jgi:signal transduction histidine kinase